MRVIVADGRREVRSGLQVLFEQERIELVGEAIDADSLFAAVSNHAADVLLLDWELMGAGTSAAIQALRSAAPELRIVVRSGRPELRSLALADGVDGFVTKAEPPEQVLRAMDRAVGQTAGTARTNGEERDETTAQRLPQEAAGIPDHLRHHHRGVRPGGDGEHGREDQPAGQRRHQVLRRQGDRLGRVGLHDEHVDAAVDQQDRRDREGAGRAGRVRHASPCSSPRRGPP